MDTFFSPPLNQKIAIYLKKKKKPERIIQYDQNLSPPSSSSNLKSSIKQSVLLLLDGGWVSFFCYGS